MNNDISGGGLMARQLLEADPRKCTGCGMCRLTCAMVKEGRAHAALSRIRLIRYVHPQLHLPVVCRHCEDAPCKAVCPREAISIEHASGRVIIDYARCISCKMCAAACPFGAVGFDGERRRVFKCDLCGGDPQCVRFCFPGALTWVPAHRQADVSVRTAARLRLAGGKIR